MRIIVLFSPTGGMGRTTLAKVLAVGLVAGQRMWTVALLDATTREGSSELVAWGRRLRRRSEEFRDQMVARQARDVGEVLDELDLAAAGTRMPDGAPPHLVLIDTGAEVDGRAHVALRAAHLVLAPVRSLQGAETAGPRIKAALPAHVEARQVPCGFEPSGADAQVEQRLAGRAMRLMRTGADLPCEPRLVDALHAAPPPAWPLEGPVWALAEAVAEEVGELIAYDMGTRMTKPDHPTHRLMLRPEDVPPWLPPKVTPKFGQG